MPRISEGLNRAQESKLIKLLSKLHGSLSAAVFTQLARIIPQPIVELVILRWDGKEVETLLIPRPEDDIVWPGMVHNPGTALRQSDYMREDKNPLNGAWERLTEELGGSKFNTPMFAGLLYPMTKRGPIVAQIFYATLPSNHVLQKGQEWVNILDLEDRPDFDQEQLEHILLAADEFGARLL